MPLLLEGFPRRALLPPTTTRLSSPLNSHGTCAYAITADQWMSLSFTSLDPLRPGLDQIHSLYQTLDHNMAQLGFKNYL